jgi:hypothetical protein
MEIDTYFFEYTIEPQYFSTKCKRRYIPKQIEKMPPAIFHHINIFNSVNFVNSVKTIFSRIEDFPGIQDIVGIDRAFDASHELDFRLAHEEMQEFLAFVADAVLAGDGSAK